MKYLQYFLLTFAHGGLLIGCGNPPPKAPSQASQREAEVIESVDEIRPITVQQWAEAGLPDTDQIWRFEEIAIAADALTNMSRDDPRYLPRLDDQLSAPILKRLVAEENMEWHRRQRVDMEVRLMDATNSIAELSRAALCYRPEDADDPSLQPETIAITGAILELYSEIAPLFDKVTARRRNRYPNQSTQINESDAMMRGLAAQFCWGTISTLAEDRNSPEARIDVARQLSSTLPRILPFVDKTSRSLMFIELCEMDGDPEYGDLQPELSNLLAAVEGAWGSQVRTKFRDISQMNAHESMSAEQWTKLGIPTTDRPWSASELTSAVEILCLVANEAPNKLPRLRDPGLRELFDRLTQTGIEDESVDSTETPQSRFDAVSSRCVSLVQLASHYHGPTENLEFYGAETVLITATIIRLKLEISQLQAQHGPLSTTIFGTPTTRRPSQVPDPNLLPFLRSQLTLLKKEAIPLEFRKQHLQVYRDNLKLILKLLEADDAEALAVTIFKYVKDPSCEDLKYELTHLAVEIVKVLEPDTEETKEP